MIDVEDYRIKKAEMVFMSLSGGADSAILFYHACDVMPDKTFLVWSGSDIGRPNLKEAKAVYNFVKEKYPKVNILPHHTFEYSVRKYPKTIDQTKTEWDPKKDPKSILHNQEELKLKIVHEPDLCLNGMTSHPPEEAIKEFKLDVDEGHGILEKRRQKTRSPWGQNMTPSGKHVHYYSPFMQKDKSHVKDMYVKYGVLDTLFPLTASCIGWPDKVTLPCKVCVWCKERLWAFGTY